MVIEKLQSLKKERRFDKCVANFLMSEMVRRIYKELSNFLFCGEGNKVAMYCSKMQKKNHRGVVIERQISAQYDNSMAYIVMLTKYSILPLYFLVLLNLDSACVLFWSMKCEQKRWVDFQAERVNAHDSPVPLLPFKTLLPILNTHSFDGHIK